MGKEGVGIANDRSNVEIVLKVLDRHVVPMALEVEICNDCLACPVPIFVQNVAPVTPIEEFRIQTRVIRPREGVGTDANFMFVSHLSRFRFPT
jgi:hypothetical protein